MTTFDVTQVDSERTSIREMTEAELDAVHGGVAPIIAAVAGIATQRRGSAGFGFDTVVVAAGFLDP